MLVCSFLSSALFALFRPSRQQGTRTYKKPCRPEPETMNQEPWSLQCFQITCTNCSNITPTTNIQQKPFSNPPILIFNKKHLCSFLSPLFFFFQLFFVQPLSSWTRSSLATLPHHLLHHVCTKSIPYRAPWCNCLMTGLPGKLLFNRALGDC